MIYITFFIVILIDKRGVREAERDTILDTILDTNTDTVHHATPPLEAETEKKMYAPASTPSTPHSSKRGMSKKRYGASTPRTQSKRGKRQHP